MIFRSLNVHVLQGYETFSHSLLPSSRLDLGFIRSLVGKKIVFLTTNTINYWWGDSDNQRRMHWFAYWKLCGPKKEGGMGSQDIHCFNLALLAKNMLGG